MTQTRIRNPMTEPTTIATITPMLNAEAAVLRTPEADDIFLCGVKIIL
jgi:hypothetical protein